MQPAFKRSASKGGGIWRAVGLTREHKSAPKRDYEMLGKYVKFPVVEFPKSKNRGWINGLLPRCIELQVCEPRRTGDRQQDLPLFSAVSKLRAVNSMPLDQPLTQDPFVIEIGFALGAITCDFKGVESTGTQRASFALETVSNARFVFSDQFATQKLRNS
jgi:hypothetical protein